MSELEDAAREELADLWADLDREIRYAYTGDWSIGCENIKERIHRLTRLVGPTPWEQVQISLLERGVYQRINAEVGYEVEVDMQRVAEVRAVINASLTGP
jgi:hypothetical protein